MAVDLIPGDRNRTRLAAIALLPARAAGFPFIPEKIIGTEVQSTQSFIFLKVKSGSVATFVNEPGYSIAAKVLHENARLSKIAKIRKLLMSMDSRGYWKRPEN